MSERDPTPYASRTPVPLPTTEAQVALMEQHAFNFRQVYGSPMRIPPTLHTHLRLAGMDMRNVEADPSLEGVSPR